jgi:hypothetical protein
MKKILVALVALVCLSAILLSGCANVVLAFGDGVVLDKPYDNHDFAKVEITNAYYYEISEAGYYSLVGTTSQNLVEYIDIHQSGNTLYVGLKDGSYGNSHFKVTITMPGLDKLVVSGACHGKVTGFKTNGNFDLTVSGASQCEIEGSAVSANIEVTGASHVDAADFQIQDANVMVSGASSATVNATGTLNVDVTGVSSLNYLGNPILGKVKVEGISSIYRK